MDSNVYQKENTRYKAAESGRTFHVDDVEDDDDQGDSGRCGVGEGDVCAHEQAICQTPHVITTTVTHCASTEQTFSTLLCSCMVCRWDNNSTNNNWKSQKNQKCPQTLLAAENILWTDKSTQRTDSHLQNGDILSFTFIRDSIVASIDKMTKMEVPWLILAEPWETLPLVSNR